MGNKRKSALYFIAAIMFGFASLMPKSFQAELADMQKKKVNVDYEVAIGIFDFVFWMLIITAIYFLGMSILYCFGDDKKQQEENSDATETAMREKGKVQCRSCGHWMAENAEKCMRCGTIVTKQVQRPKVITSIAQWEAENAPKKSCVFCGKTMRADETFCGTCGRRQD